MHNPFVRKIKNLSSLVLLIFLPFCCWSFSDENLKVKSGYYEITGEIDLNNQVLNLQKDCKLIFRNGCISNGKIVFNNNHLEGNIKFSNCILNGSVSNEEILLSWFTLTEIQLNLGNIKKKAFELNRTLIENLLSLSDEKTLIIDRLCYCKESIEIKNKIKIKGNSNPQGVYALLYQNAENGFYFPDNKTGFTVCNGGSLSISGLCILGDSLFLSGRLDAPFDSINSCGIDVKNGGILNDFNHSTVHGFTYGIRINGSALLKECINSYFTLCRYGFWAEDSKNMDFSGCRFNTNLVNYRFYDAKDSGFDCNLEYDDGNLLRKSGGGVYLKNCENVNFERCRFEFNNISVIIDESGRNINIKNSIFDTSSSAHIQIYTEEKSIASELPANNQDKPKNTILFSGNTFARGVHSDINTSSYFYSHPGLGIALITEKGTAGSAISFKNNIVSDTLQIEKNKDYSYQNCIFKIKSSIKSHYIIMGNSFGNCKSENLFSFEPGTSENLNLEYQENITGENKTVIFEKPVLINAD